MNRRDCIRNLSAAAGTLAAPAWLRAAARPAGANRKPNIVVIMVDDMGFSDIGCYGGEIATPNIDRLAAGGLRFTQFYNNAKCEPTRNSLFTGNYPGWQIKGETAQWPAEMKAAGYRAYMTGKVHAHSAGGFDRACTMTSGGNYWNLRRDGKDGPPGPLRIDGKESPEFVTSHPKFYTTDVFTDFALDYLEQDKASDKPFFLYVAYNAPHYPLHAWPEDIAKYRGKYMIGWDELRRRRCEKQIELGIIDKTLKMSPRDEKVPEWKSLDEKTKHSWDLHMAVYAAMIDRIDQNVGRILAKIRELGQEDNTVVLFLSDNGGCGKSCNAANDTDSEPGPRNGWHYVGTGWANASNTPFRKFKTWDHEGGISTPLIAYWPGRIAPGSFDRHWGNVMDISATCYDLAGHKPAAKIGGLSLAPAFDGRKRPLHDALCWAIIKGKAARRGPWKAVRYADESWRLFNVESDRTELNDLSSKNPDKLNELVSQWDTWSKKCRFIGENDE